MMMCTEHANMLNVPAEAFAVNRLKQLHVEDGNARDYMVQRRHLKSVFRPD